MQKLINVSIGGLELIGELNQSQAAAEFFARLPLRLTLTRWGQEYYGALGGPLDCRKGRLKEEMSVGEIAYWEPGRAFCLFFGPTPASIGDEPRAASPVCSLGMVSGPWDELSALGPETEAHIEAAEVKP